VLSFLHLEDLVAKAGTALGTLPWVPTNGAMPQTDLLNQFGLQRNPFVDRTAERTKLDASALYMQSDLRCFEPSATTYVFFGRRGAGKTTVRLMVRPARACIHVRTAPSPAPPACLLCSPLCGGATDAARIRRVQRPRAGKRQVARPLHGRPVPARPHDGLPAQLPGDHQVE
jgi:hypothetical protein